MPINIRQKGQEGEREIQRALEPIVRDLMAKHGYPVPDKPVIQRNQNQSAVGGSDLSNTFGLCIEVKRQEQLAVNTWWAQCEKAARDNNERAVLLYRQNGKKWKCVLNAWLPLVGNDAQRQSRVSIEWEDFLLWFEVWVTRCLENGYHLPRV